MSRIILYHASPVPNLVGDVVHTTMDVVNDHNGKISAPRYACLASSPAQAFFWAGQLSDRSDSWYIYRVELMGYTLVENCEGGYHVEGVGDLMEARKVTAHRDVDGEVNVFSPMPIVGVEAKIKFK